MWLDAHGLPGEGLLVGVVGDGEAPTGLGLRDHAHDLVTDEGHVATELVLDRRVKGGTLERGGPLVEAGVAEGEADAAAVGLLARALGAEADEVHGAHPVDHAREGGGRVARLVIEP